MFLYWGEGGKTCCFELANTDPSIIEFFVLWILDFGIEKGDIRIRLDLYKDMDIKSEFIFWQNITGISSDRFKVSIKKSSLSSLTYKNGFGHGTCRIVISKGKIFNYMIQSLQYIRNTFIVRTPGLEPGTDRV